MSRQERNFITAVRSLMTMDEWHRQYQFVLDDLIHLIGEQNVDIVRQYIAEDPNQYNAYHKGELYPIWNESVLWEFICNIVGIDEERGEDS